MLGQPGHNTTARLIASQFPGHECMDDLTTEGSFDAQAKWVIGVFGVFSFACYSRVFVKPGTGKRPVDSCRD